MLQVEFYILATKILQENNIGLKPSSACSFRDLVDESLEHHFACVLPLHLLEKFRFGKISLVNEKNSF